MTNTLDNRLELLKENPHWQELQALWKEMNSFKQNVQASDTRDFYDNKVNRLKTLVLNTLYKLKKEHLINDDEEITLSKITFRRLKHLKRIFSGPMCYRPMLAGYLEMQSLDTLEKRYKLLEKLFKESKINQKVYEESQKQINIELTNSQHMQNVYLLNHELDVDTMKALYAEKISPEMDESIISLIIALNG